MVGSANNASSTPTWGAIDCVISDNIIVAGVDDGSYFGGITIGGAAGDPARVKVTGNELYYCGADGTHGNLTAIFANKYSCGLIISKNIIHSPTRNAIRLYQHHQGFSITGNTITDAWADIGGVANGIWIDEDNNTGHISGNTFIRTGNMSSKTADFSRCILVDDVAGDLCRCR